MCTQFTGLKISIYEKLFEEIHSKVYLINVLGLSSQVVNMLCLPNKNLHKHLHFGVMSKLETLHLV